MEISQTLPSGLPGVNAAGQEREPMQDGPARIRLCGVADVAPGEALKVETHGLTLAVFNLDGEFHVTDDQCTHGPGSLSEGFVDGDCIECNFHQGVFNIKTGAVVQPPCTVPIKTYPVTVDGGEVFIAGDAEAGGGAVKS